MTRLPSFRKGLTAMAAMVLVACGESVAPLSPGPEAAPAASQKLRVVQRTGIEDWANSGVRYAGRSRVTHRNEDGNAASASAWIGPEGGVLTVGEMTLTVPAGALDERVRIKMTLPQGRPLVVEFGPHGLRFNVPATLTIDLSGSEADGDAELQSRLVGVYYESEVVDGQVAPVETYEVTVAGDDVVSIPIHHFSGYALAVG